MSAKCYNRQLFSSYGLVSFRIFPRHNLRNILLGYGQPFTPFVFNLTSLPALAGLNSRLKNGRMPFFNLYPSSNIPSLVYLYRNPICDNKPDSRNYKYKIKGQKDSIFYRNK